MRQYELMLVVRPDKAVETKEQQESIVKTLLGSAQAHIREITPLGKKRLAYPIQKHSDGVYLLAALESVGLRAAELEKQARLGGDVIRYLLILKS